MMTDLTAAQAALADLVALSEGRLSLDDFGVWVPPQEREDGTKSWPYVAYTARVQQAMAALRGLVDLEGTHDYVEWQKHRPQPLDQPDVIARMDARDLAYQVTRFGRGERFSEGYQLRIVESGALRAALERAVALAKAG